MSRGPRVLTATITPTSSSPSVVVGSNKFTDSAGNNNTTSNTYNWTHDATPPTMTLTSSAVADGGNHNAAVTMTFTSSEETGDFTESDITVTNGTLSGFSGSDTTYTATITPISEGDVSVSVKDDTFTDTAGNNNTASNTFSWTYATTACLLYTSPSPRDATLTRMPSSA